MQIWTIISGTETELCGFSDEQSCLTNVKLLEVEKDIDMGLTIVFSEGFWPSPNILEKI